MAAKIKEDPLFLIRKKEDETKKDLVQNPLKMKQIREMLNLSVGDRHKHKKSKKRKLKKSKKESRRKQVSDIDEPYRSKNGHDSLKRKEFRGKEESSPERDVKRKSRKSHRRSWQSDMSDGGDEWRKERLDSKRNGASRHRMKYSKEEEGPKSKVRRRSNSFDESPRENGSRHAKDKQHGNKSERQRPRRSYSSGDDEETFTKRFAELVDYIALNILAF